MTDARRVLIIGGKDAHDFLQGLVTNDVNKIETGLVYAALLTPQGKFLVDFFLSKHPDGILLDVQDDQADALATRLSMYKLRADVTIDRSPLHVHRGLGPAPEGAFADPRSAKLGWRAYRDMPATAEATDWTEQRIAACVPKTGAELGPDSYILEMGFERLNGVDFKKGCYVGQEVTARMKHKTELRKGLALVNVIGPAEPGAEITANGKPVGTLQSRVGDKALAYLRFDRASVDMMAGDAKVSWTGKPD
ncbi:YgfZ/GcvT domain-containing protein [Cognatishimia maritima]|uniref:CAF17 C-terminal domain-containing protein n=1 Tax=Cognatishimia maritima TaxID=870908 RepID=A0A1M5V074_9RHOB|nr:folate-binding protein YgfZ [Cognatishimia maritima]SHH68641.1 hypothetical protein SAMN04488044_3026 [Cognatishimia maritima]